MPAIIDIRRERIVVETDSYRVEGDITMPKGSYRNALADYLNRGDQEFICLSNVELMTLDGSGQVWNHPFLSLAKRHIRLVVPIGPPEGS